MTGVDCELFRPFRATEVFAVDTQGVALGCHITALQAEAPDSKRGSAADTDAIRWNQTAWT
jgi:hypothetical protein